MRSALTTPQQQEVIVDTPVAAEMRNSFLEYSMSVIVSRALPDVRDGLKPVHRRILYSLHDQGIRPGTAYKKCARVVGDVMGKYHPHGDSAIYEALVRLAQDFAMRLPIVDGHGNFGSLDDPPAASRYTECRMAPASLSLVGELQEDTVDFRPNYDGQEQEPSVLPAAFPNLLVNGSSGIAVGMATNMAPHNLVEVIAGLRAMLANEKITLAEMMEHIPGPDLPTKGIIIGTDMIKEAYTSGRGTFRMRAAASVPDSSARRKGIVVTELPYGVGPEKVVAKIKELQNQKRLLGVSAINDHSDRKSGLKLVIECKTGFNPYAVLEELYKYTPLEESFGINNVALVNGQPQTLGLLALCRHYLNHRIEVVTRRTKFRLRKAEARMHIVEGLLIALAAIDEVVAVIRASRDTESARNKLRRQFKLSEIQANHILEMPLRRLTSLEVTKLKGEQKELEREIAEYKKLLASDKEMRTLVGDELQHMATIHGTPRQTRLLAVAPDPAKGADSLEVPDDPTVVTLTASGLISRSESLDGKVVPFKGKHGRHDVVISQLATTNRAVIGGITDKGRLLRVSVVELPLAQAKNRGGNTKEFFLELAGEERVVGLVALPDPKSKEAQDSTGILIATRQGAVKRILPTAYPLKTGQEVIGLKDGDAVVGIVALPNEDVDVVLVSDGAQLLRTPVAGIRPSGRTAGGVAGMKVGENQVIAVGIAQEGVDAVLATVANSGALKVSTLLEYPAKGRGGAGVRCHTFRKGEDRLAAAWIGEGKGFVLTVANEAVALPTERARRDASGTTTVEGEIAYVGAGRS